MAFLKNVYKELNIIKNVVTKALLNFIYRDLDIFQQKFKSSQNHVGILETIGCTPLPSKKFAIFVYYEDEISESVKRILSELRVQNINVVLICNQKLNNQQKSYFHQKCHTIILRDNQGFDFGAYKDAVKFLCDQKVQLKRVIFLNDSVFFASKGLKEFVSGLLGEADVIAAYENWGEDHHLQSFAMSISNNVFWSDRFQKFWKNYIPINNRIYAIEKGEKKLSATALREACSTKVLYSVADLSLGLPSTDLEISEKLEIKMHNHGRHKIRKTEGERVRSKFLGHLISNVINTTSPIHSGAYFFPKYLDSPLLKKDIVYRDRFAFWEVEEWSREFLTDEEQKEFLTILRKKGDYSGLSRIDRQKFKVGVK